MPERKPKKKCYSCGKFRTVSAFYQSKSPLHADGLLPICRDCCLKLSLDDDRNTLDIERFKRMLRQTDKPFLESVYDSTTQEIENQYPEKSGEAWVKCFIGKYFKNLITYRQYANLTYDDSDEMKQARQQQQGRKIVYVDTDTEDEFSIFIKAQRRYAIELYKYLLEEYQELTENQRELLRNYISKCNFLQTMFVLDEYDCIADIEAVLIALADFKRSIGDHEFADFLENIEIQEGDNN